MILESKPDTLGPEHRNMLYIDPETVTVSVVVERLHCAGGVDEHHQFNCKLNHWTTYGWEEVGTEVLRVCQCPAAKSPWEQ